LRNKFNSLAKKIILAHQIALQLNDIKIIIPIKGNKKKLLELSYKNAFTSKKKKDLLKNKTSNNNVRILETLKKDLHLDNLPDYIECFDNSNIQGTNPVASVVVFKNAQPSKKDYRHFNIKTVTGPDDYSSMEEIVMRRYQRLIKEKQPLPKLILIDGGRGQLNAALKSLALLNITNKITVVGIAKRLEEIYFPNDPFPIHINKKSESIKLLQYLRNEAHRFAINFHRLKRSKTQIESELEQIKGIGSNSVKKLLREFKSVKKIGSTTLEELTLLLGSKRADIIFNYFKGKSIRP
jgi:excinuclease ABC subunit C